MRAAPHRAYAGPLHGVAVGVRSCSAALSATDLELDPSDSLGRRAPMNPALGRSFSDDTADVHVGALTTALPLAAPARATVGDSASERSLFILVRSGPSNRRARLMVRALRSFSAPRRPSASILDWLARLSVAS